MDVTRAAVVAEARTWVGTPFQHNQSCKGHGCDCIGLVIGIYRALGSLAASYQPEPYSQQWHAHKNEEVLLHNTLALGFAIVSREPQPADLLVFKYGKVCSHVGIYLGNDEFIHAYFSLKRAVIQPLRGELADRMKYVMTSPWVID